MPINLKQLFIKQAPQWSALYSLFNSIQLQSLEQFLNYRTKEAIIFPSIKNIFRAYALTPLEKVKVVIVGQDPYHAPNQAHGLSFSVLHPTPAPPSLKNMFKELSEDIELPTPKNGDLSSWAKQGVLLLNKVLTVEQGNANSHKGKGWETLTQSTVELISNEKENVVFILWGAQAQQLKKFIHLDKHYILESPHPSPLSSYRGFFGSKPFSKTNSFLKANNISPINWSLD